MSVGPGSETTRAQFPAPRHKAPRGAVGVEWLDSKIEYLRALARPYLGQGSDLAYDVGPWDALKLIGLLYAHDVYLDILSKQLEKGRWAKLYYVDLNAANGLVRLDRTRTILPGSALLAANYARPEAARKYDHLILIEPNRDACDALEARLSIGLTSDKFDVVSKPASEAVPDVIDRLRSADAHYLALFDPFAFRQGDWSAYGRLLSSTERGDMIITFQTTAAKRAGESAFAPFLGEAIPDLKLLSEPEVLERFKDRLRPHRGAVEHVRIRAGRGYGRYYYDFVYAAARTWSNNPYLSAFDDLRTKVESLSGTQIAEVIRNPPLRHFVKDDPG